jgi:hypothetical protein
MSLGTRGFKSHSRRYFHGLFRNHMKIDEVLIYTWNRAQITKLRSEIFVKNELEGEISSVTEITERQRRSIRRIFSKMVQFDPSEARILFLWSQQIQLYFELSCAVGAIDHQGRLHWPVSELYIGYGNWQCTCCNQCSFRGSKTVSVDLMKKNS